MSPTNQGYELCPSHRYCRETSLNMPVDYIDSVSNAVLQQLDQDSSILSSLTLRPEKRQLMEALNDMPSNAGLPNMKYGFSF